MLVGLIVTAWLITPVEAQQSNDRPNKIGAFLDEGLNLERANFQTLPGVPSCCPRFESGSGWGLTGGLAFTVPLAGFALQTRLGYSSLSALLRQLEHSTVLVQGAPAQATFEHSVQSSLGMFWAAPLLEFEPFSRFEVGVGPQIGIPVGASYTEKEVLQDPASGTFENGRRVRNEFSGATPDLEKVGFAVQGGIRYRLPLSRSGDGSPGSLELVPEIMGVYSLTPVVKGMDWYSHAIRFGVGVEYALGSPKEAPPIAIVTPDTPITPHTPVVQEPQSPKLTADLHADMIDSELHVRPMRTLLVEDYIRTQYRPLLNFVFFDINSSQIPARYHALHDGEVQSFGVNRLNELETLPLYYEALNVIGARMHTHPTGRLRIVGCNANVGVERGARKLSRARAQTVEQYFEHTWHIDPSRMTIEARDLPEKPSSVDDSDGAEENRRVEIYSNEWEVLEPVFTTDTAHIPKPPMIRLRPTSVAEAGLSKWDVSTYADAVTLKEYSGKLKEFSGKDSLPDRLDWDLEKERERALAAIDTIRATLTLTDRAGQSVESNDIVIPVRHYTLPDKHREGSIDTIISRYSLILFDFDRGELSDANRRIANFVKQRISDVAKVSILGYTDRIGSDEYNRQLSEMRARSTEKVIGITNGDVRGLGRSVLLYDNSLPEGRFYSRTVTVIVSTPTKR